MQSNCMYTATELCAFCVLYRDGTSKYMLRVEEFKAE